MDNLGVRRPVDATAKSNSKAHGLGRNNMITR